MREALHIDVLGILAAPLGEILIHVYSNTDRSAEAQRSEPQKVRGELLQAARRESVAHGRIGRRCLRRRGHVSSGLGLSQAVRSSAVLIVVPSSPALPRPQ